MGVSNGKCQITPKVLEIQRDRVCEKIGAYIFTVQFSREKVEMERLHTVQYQEFSAQHERMARFSQFITSYQEYPQSDGSVSCDVGSTISPAQSLQVLSNRGVQMQLGIRNDWPKSVAPGGGTPELGIGFLDYYSGPRINVQTDSLENLTVNEQHSVREKLMDRHLSRVEIWVSSQYEVYDW